MGTATAHTLQAQKPPFTDQEPIALSWFFFFFLISGFCSLLYEIIWLRLAMAQFGVTSAMVSIVVSMFMAGLGIGSWVSGLLLRKHGESIQFSALRLYAAVELLVGISAVLVPLELLWGRHLLERISLSSSWEYYLASGIWIALTLVPWCGCMGATIPVAMFAIKQTFDTESKRSFSFLYLANVLGAVLGSIIPLFLIELNGFRGTLQIGAVLNATIALAAIGVSLKVKQIASREKSSSLAQNAVNKTVKDRKLLLLLFTTGLTSMGLEMVWIRQFTPYLGTVVYAFAAILGFYLLATFIGSQIYRIWSRRHSQEWIYIWPLIGLLALFPLVTADPQWKFAFLNSFNADALRLFLGVAPFSGLLGFVTPMLVDRWSDGDPDKAGTAYAINVLGCILGPLLAAFILLPSMNERWVVLLLALPWMGFGAFAKRDSTEKSRNLVPQYVVAAAVAASAVLAVVLTKSYEQRFAHSVVLRDNTATIIATGEGRQKLLLVNGVGITALTPITKMMAHLPMAFHEQPPQNALVICFGMGTTFRSLLSWNAHTTAVDLVPSVPKMFSYFHSDAAQLLHSPLAHVVTDDGRRYLERTTDQFDVITIDPPPPVAAAGSSLLYTKEFYSIIKPHLRRNGILQQWLPYGDPMVQSSVARALKESFPYVRVFKSFYGNGFHFLASLQPIPMLNPEQLAEKLPPTAKNDIVEWGPGNTPALQFAMVMRYEVVLDSMIGEVPHGTALVDDHPVNEYYFLRSRHEPDFLP